MDWRLCLFAKGKPAICPLANFLLSVLGRARIESFVTLRMMRGTSQKGEIADVHLSSFTSIRITKGKITAYTYRQTHCVQVFQPYFPAQVCIKESGQVLATSTRDGSCVETNSNTEMISHAFLQWKFGEVRKYISTDQRPL